MGDPVGASIGAVSLTIQLLDGCVKGYQYFIAAAGMPKSCSYMRTRLQIEYLRLSNWGEVVGFIAYQEGQDLLDRSEADRLVLVAILSEIRALMDDFADINGKYEDQLRHDESHGAKKNAEDLDLIEEFSNISLEYEKKAVERKYIRGTNHVINHMRMAKDLVRNPKRLVWVAFDEQVFVKLLGRLTELNDYLQELLHGHQARKLEQVTEKTYMEMVQVRSSVDELKHLVTAAMLLEDRGHSPTSALRRRNDHGLAGLADFKSLNAANEAPSGQKPPDYDSVISATHLNYSQIYYEEDASSSSSRIRAEGKFFPGDGTQTQVWIEWKAYKEKWDPKLDKYVPQEDNIHRVRELAALLQSTKPKEFCAPRCLGYFDDRDDASHSEHECRFGLVFEKPAADLKPISLHDLLKTPTPSLTERIALAHKISVCVLYLHAVNWLHKSLRSDSIIFFSPSRPLSDPYLTGYEYARADRPGGTTTGGDVDQWTELYMHPNYQGPGTKGLYRKTFDIYSLGIILLEIAYWQPIEEILGLNMDSLTFFDDIKSIRETLLEPGAKVMETLKANLGDRYAGAVRGCLQGRSAFGIREGEREADVGTGARLQRGFMRVVTDGLEGITL
ncbi:MAG: hypothetical protein LQ343_003500 [Gyalolechia ehrenbergii]|nr:MAG: hypothetical protein LQ343_003500 [Gyalolechia ehrenbergii]